MLSSCQLLYSFSYRRSIEGRKEHFGKEETGDIIIVREHRRWAYILPNTFTSLNLACGFASIMLTINDKAYMACLALGLGGLFDVVDGRIARMVGSQSLFGEQFDSMSDLTSFGVAPAILIHHQYLSLHGRLGMAVVFFFVLCAALRLARFNANISKIHTDHFQGLPVPCAAMGLVGFVLFGLELGGPLFMEYAVVPYIIIYSTLMISNVPFPAFKKSEWVKAHQKYVFLIIVSVLASLFVYGEIVIGLVITTYVLGSLGHFLVHRGKNRDIFGWDEDSESEGIK